MDSNIRKLEKYDLLKKQLKEKGTYSNLKIEVQKNLQSDEKGTNSPHRRSSLSPLQSPRKREWMQCRSCTCPNFRAQPTASWVCGCGHMNVKHITYL
eukprot:TRINITY_DN3239_c0_g3_i2.p1 TRINITY_DN3239_c0_g3~~TRINITY_DN3239_c0_g3_i2.p1  ORF type:complete len:112 (+),score=19.16 TRINITY_DN3239_c0_g3_i2:47-337(+)